MSLLGDIVTDLLNEFGSTATHLSHQGRDTTDDFWSNDLGHENNGTDILVATQGMVSGTQLEEYGFNPDGDIMFWTEASVEEGDLIRHTGDDWIVSEVQEIQTKGNTLVLGLNCNEIQETE